MILVRGGCAARTTLWHQCFAFGKGGISSLASWPDAVARLAANFLRLVTFCMLPIACKERCDEERCFRDEIPPRMTRARLVANTLAPWNEADNC